MDKAENPQLVLIRSLIDAKKQIPQLKVTAKADQYKYLELDELLAAIEPHLLANNLVVVQQIEGKFLITTLWHVEGGCLSSRIPLQSLLDKMPSNRGAAQAYGSCISYLRRYSILALLCLSPDKDMDGAVSSVKPNTGAMQRQKLMTEIKAAREEKGISKEELLEKHPTLPKMTETQLMEVLKELEEPLGGIL